MGRLTSGTNYCVGPLNDDRQCLVRYTPQPGRAGTGIEQIKQDIADSGIATPRKEVLLHMVALQANSATADCCCLVGSEESAAVAVALSQDHMKAEAFCWYGADGTASLIECGIRACLDQLGVSCGVLEDAIAALTTGGSSPASAVVALGREAVDGRDSDFVALVVEMERQLQQAGENDVIDYRNFGDIISVSLGDPLLRRTSPTKGVEGSTLLGEPLPAQDGKEIEFAENCEGTACAVDDCDLLVAALSGYPQIIPHGVTVTPVFKVKQVDLSTGNLNFKGSLEIEKDVNDGMEVSAGGDISIGGVVESAQLRAGGSIVVQGGIFGQSLAQTAPGVKKYSATVVAGGDIKAQFAENCELQATGDILINEFAMQCDIRSSGSITIGKDDGHPGHIVGGTCRASHHVATAMVGSRAGISTIVEAGFDPVAKNKLAETQLRLRELEQQIEEIVKTITYLKEHPTPSSAAIVQVKDKIRTKLLDQKMELISKEKRLQKALVLDEAAYIDVSQRVCAGSVFKLGTSSLQVSEDGAGMRLSLQEGEITATAK